MSRWIEDDYLDMEEMRREVAAEFVEDYCDHCKNRFEDECHMCFGNAFYFDEVNDED